MGLIHEEWWSIDYERTWLASRLSDRQTTEEKMDFVRQYLTALPTRYTSFTGDGPMDEMEYQDMVTFCLRQLYELEYGR